MLSAIGEVLFVKNVGMVRGVRLFVCFFIVSLNLEMYEL
jgi:hypothetical protein